MGGPTSGQLIEYVHSFDPRSWYCLHIAEGSLNCSHATVQNKVAAERARALHAELAAILPTREGRAEGLLLWRYRGGPWEPAGSFSFTG